MNKGQRTIALLLTVIAVLLGLNLLEGNAPRAEAQPADSGPLVGEGDPSVVKWFPVGNTRYYRVWSDGQIDFFIKAANSQCVNFQFAEVVLPATDHPFPVVDAEADGVDAGIRFVIEFADGRADYVEFGGQNEVLDHCTIAGEGSPFHCLGDTDRSGEIDFTDLLTVLSQWGSCKG